MPLPERISHISLERPFLEENVCQKGNGTNVQDKLYGVTVGYKWLHLFMPNEKHETVAADIKDYITTQKPTDPYVTY